MLGQKIDEGAHARWKRPALADIDGVNVLAVAWIKALQHGHEASRFYIRADVKQGQTGQARAAEREEARRFPIARAH